VSFRTRLRAVKKLSSSPSFLLTPAGRIGSTCTCYQFHQPEKDECAETSSRHNRVPSQAVAEFTDIPRGSRCIANASECIHFFLWVRDAWWSHSSAVHGSASPKLRDRLASTMSPTTKCSGTTPRRAAMRPRLAGKSRMKHEKKTSSKAVASIQTTTLSNHGAAPVPVVHYRRLSAQTLLSDHCHRNLRLVMRHYLPEEID